MEHLSLDVFDDVTLETSMVKIAEKLPGSLRRTPMMTYEERDLLPDNRFALSVITKTASKLNKFPINDQLNTALSNQYFEMNHGALPKEAQKIAASHIKTACLRSGIRPTKSVSLLGGHPTVSNLYIEKTGSKAGGRAYSKSPEVQDYALEKQAGDHIIRKYPIPNPELLGKAIGYFEKYAGQFSPEDRRQFAANVYNKSVSLGIPVENSAILKYAGQGYGTSVADHILVRKKLSPEYAETFDKLAGIKKTIPPDDFAAALGALDKKAGLDKYYDKNIYDPYAATFSKSASGYIYTEGDVALTEEQIKKGLKDKSAIVERHFGKTLLDSLEKEGFPVFEALPKDVKAVIAGIIMGEVT